MDNLNEVVETQAAVNKPETNPIISENLISLLQALAIIIVVIGVIAGIMSFAGAPKYDFTAEDKALKAAAYSTGIMEIVASVISAVVFYALSEICKALQAIWRKQHEA